MTFQIVKDPDYNYLRVDPVPTAEEVDRYYREEFYSRSRANYENDSGLENMREEAEYHARAYADLLALIERSIAPDNRNLKALAVADIGCGFGYWLKYLADNGVSGYGVEPVEEGIAFCASLGLEGYCLPIESLTSPPRKERVSLVSMINVLEHLREPAKVLIDLHKNWLEPGGYVLIRVPNEFNVLQVTADRLYDLKQWWVVPPQHINYFTRESLQEILSRCGYDIVEATATFPLEIFLLMGDVYVGDPVTGKQIHRKRVAFERNLDQANLADYRRNLYRAFAELGIGREVIVLAKARASAA